MVSSPMSVDAATKYHAGHGPNPHPNCPVCQAATNRCPCGAVGPCANPRCHVRTGVAPGGARLSQHRFNNDLRYRDGDHPDQTQLTPGYVLRLVRHDLGGEIDLDPCTTPDNPTGARTFYTTDDDGLEQPWGGRIFCNPPYGKAREPWVKRCAESGACGSRVILLIPAATDTRIFREAASTATAIVFVTGRLKFGTLRPNRRQHAASHPSALIGWNVHLWDCEALGWRVSPRAANSHPQSQGKP